MNGTAGPVLILGATSDIARAIAVQYARSGAALILAARDVASLDADARNLRFRYDVPVSIVECDVLCLGNPASFYDGLRDEPEVVISAIGDLGDQRLAERDAGHARRLIETNFVGPALLLAEAANRFERRGRGTLIAISSVAGERGRATNYVYGAAKAGLTAFLSGLRNRLAGAGVRVITVKPGFVYTRMTAGMKLPRLLTAKTDEVAKSIWAAHQGRRDVVYVRSVWRLVMAGIRAIPEPLFMRLSL